MKVYLKVHPDRVRTFRGEVPYLQPRHAESTPAKTCRVLTIDNIIPYLRCLNDTGGQKLLSDVLVFEENGVVLHVGPNAQNVLDLSMSKYRTRTYDRHEQKRESGGEQTCQETRQARENAHRVTPSVLH